MKKHFGIILILLFSFCFVNLPVVTGQDSNLMEVTIYGDEHKFFEPSNAPIQQKGTVYTLTGDVDSISFMGDDSVLDGNGYTVTGNITSSYAAVTIAASNITVKNLVVANGVDVGISIGGSNCVVSNCTISEIVVPDPTHTQNGAIFFWGDRNHTIIGNNLVNNSVGISAIMYSKHAFIVGNNLEGNDYGMIFQNAVNNTIYNNNFNNVHNLYLLGSDSSNFWDDGLVGNYWSNNNGTDNNADGIGDAPFVIDENNQDNYPLMTPVDVEAVPEFPIWFVLVLFVVGTLLTQFYDKKGR